MCLGSSGAVCFDARAVSTQTTVRPLSFQVITLQNNDLEDVPIELGLCPELKNVETKDNPNMRVPPPYVRSQGPGRVAEYLVRYGRSHRPGKVR